MKRIFITVGILLIASLLLIYYFLGSRHTSYYDLVDNFSAAIEKPGNMNLETCGYTPNARQEADLGLLDAGTGYEGFLYKKTYVSHSSFFRKIILNDIFKAETVLLKNGKWLREIPQSISSNEFVLTVGIKNLPTESIEASRRNRKHPVHKLYELGFESGRAQNKIIISYNRSSRDIILANDKEIFAEIPPANYLSSRSGKIRLFFLFRAEDTLIFTGKSKISFYESDNTFNGRFSFKGFGNEIKNLDVLKIRSISPSFRTNLLKYLRIESILATETPEPLVSYWNELEKEDKLQGRLSEDLYLRRLKINNDTRRAIILPLGKSILYENIRLPEGAEFRCGISSHPGTYISNESLKMEIVIKDQSDTDLSAAFPFSLSYNSSGRWKEARIDLSEFENRDVTIILSSISTGGAKAITQPGLVAWGAPQIRSARKKEEKNLILISLDTLSANHMSSYGYSRNTTPVLDEWVKTAAFFENSISNSSWTLSSHMSMFTSKYPGEIGIEAAPNAEHIKRSRLADGIPTLATYLRLNGYKTAAITGAGYVSSVFGFDRGFLSYKEYPQRQNIKQEMSEVLRFIEENRDEKFFLFFHTFEIHSPYRRRHFRPLGSSNRERVIANYDSGIFYTDAQFKRLFQALKDLGLYDNTMIIVTSDHGERFDEVGEDGREGTHGHTLYDSVLRVPLIIGGCPEFETGRKVKTVVSGVDIMPTILDFLDIDYPEKTLRGMTLLPLIEANKKEERFAYSSNILGGKEDQESLRGLSHKLIRHLDIKSSKEMKDRREYYRLSDDPAEKINIRQSRGIKTFLERIIPISRSIFRNKSKIKKSFGKSSRFNRLHRDINLGGYIDPS